jgi:UDP-glucose 4-epimerase
MIPISISIILVEKAPAKFSDGNRIKGFAFIQGAIKTNILTMKKEHAEGASIIVYGKRTGPNQLAGTMNAIEIEADLIHKKPRPEDIQDSLADISTAEKDLGYEPYFDPISGSRDA